MTLSMGPIGHRAANVVAIAASSSGYTGRWRSPTAIGTRDHAPRIGRRHGTFHCSREQARRTAGRTSWTVWRRRPLTYQTSAILSGQVADPLRSDDSGVCTLHVSLRLASTYRPITGVERTGACNSSTSTHGPLLKPGSRLLVTCVGPEPSHAVSNHSHCPKGASK
jgi:hypothetical protein